MRFLALYRGRFRSAGTAGLPWRKRLVNPPPFLSSDSSQFPISTTTVLELASNVGVKLQCNLAERVQRARQGRAAHV